MLDKPVDEIVYEGGKVVGVKSKDEVCLYTLQVNQGMFLALYTFLSFLYSVLHPSVYLPFVYLQHSCFT